MTKFTKGQRLDHMELSWICVCVDEGLAVFALHSIEEEENSIPIDYSRLIAISQNDAEKFKDKLIEDHPLCDNCGEHASRYSLGEACSRCHC